MNNEQMQFGVNQAFKFLYAFLTTVPIIYLLISISSYYSVLLTFGQVPPYEGFIDNLIKETGKEFRIFPGNYGILVIFAFFYSSVFVVPLVTIANALLRFFSNNVIFYKWRALIMILIYAMSILLSAWTDAVGWYGQYVLD